MFAPKLRGIQLGRGLAAVTVVISHAAGLNGSTATFSLGVSAVEFFFVLSGFIVFRIHAADLSQPSRLARFITKRFVRIYPVYWIVLALLVALSVQAGRPIAERLDPWTVTRAVLLLPGTGSILSVSWSLTYELGFYLTVAAMIFRVRVGIALLAAWVVASIVLWQAGGRQPYAIDFVLGLLIALMAEKVALPRAGLCVAAGLLTMAAALTWQLPILTGLGAAAGIIGLIQINRIPRSMELLGDASYSIYLLHFPALAFVGREFGVTSPAVLTLVGIGAGLALHLTVEKPLLRAFTARRSISSGLPAPAI